MEFNAGSKLLISLRSYTVEEEAQPLQELNILHIIAGLNKIVRYVYQIIAAGGLNKIGRYVYQIIEELSTKALIYFNAVSSSHVKYAIKFTY